MDGDHLALVYEYMSQGTLLDYIRGYESCISLLNLHSEIGISHIRFLMFL